MLRRLLFLTCVIIASFAAPRSATAVYQVNGGRFLQADPNASGLSISSSLAFHGSAPAAHTPFVDLSERLGDGINLFQYNRSHPIAHSDPSGLFALPALAAGVGIGVGMMMPGPGDFIQGALQSMVSEYAANQDWDVGWAGDWSTGDDWHSRLDNSWVGRSMVRGVYDSFEIGYGDYTVNPLDYLGSASGSRTSKSRFSTPHGVASFSRIEIVDGFRATVYANPSKGRSFVVFDSASVKTTVRVTPSSRPKERLDANKLAGFDKTPDGWVWHHHSWKSGVMELVPARLHGKVGHIGRATW